MIETDCTTYYGDCYGNGGGTYCTDTDLGLLGCDNVPGSGAVPDDCGKCTGGTTGLTACIPIDCNSINVTLSGVAGPLSYLPGSIINLSASIDQPGSVTNLNYNFQAYFSGNSYDLWDGYGTSRTYNYTMKVLGDIQFTVTATYTCNGTQYTTTSDEVDVSSQFCASDLATKYSSNITSAWSNTLTATSSGTGKYEYGFFCSFDGTNFNTIDFNNNVACDTLENISESTIFIPNGANPNIGATWYIGKFHTHPPLTNCDPSQYRDLGPSSIDLGNSTDLPSIVRDYISRVYGGNAANLSTKDYQYNASCTTY